MFTSVVELTDILSFIGDFKRPLIEGTQVMNCNHIVEFGCVENNNKTLKIVAMCLKTSDLSGKPHELEVIKSINNGSVKLSAKCSCKAGSGKCKHIVGLMLKLQKTSIEELDERSCTDLPQQWGKLGQAASKYLHKPVPVLEFCHVFPTTTVYDKSLPNDISEDLQQEIRSYFLQSY
ncbi:uncharacterized protein LOC111035501 [Myzus persicae]|uniref:uncharacterized protein LOC111035501 n=1 Tax=Myzus persicae TaxID=13164 RepID=UPI000B932764|nr:uncharacterized protein LOC111035501 [Myzus persicae]